MEGKVWLRMGEAHFLGGRRVALLEGIEEFGSISKAAKAVGISYKTAWDLVTEMNNLAGSPLVLPAAGGKGGGGTRLSEEGREMIGKYRSLRREHRKLLRELGGRLGGSDALPPPLRGDALHVSVKNNYLVTVARIRKGIVSTEVVLSLKGSTELCAIVTKESAERLELQEGMEAHVFFPESSVILGRDLHAARTSARNRLCGTVLRLVKGPVDTEVTIALAGGNTLCAVVTGESVERLGLKEGDHACALVKASSVILGVAG